MFLLLPTQLYVTVGILLTNGKHLNYRIISLNCEVWAHKTSLIPPLVIEVPVHIVG